MKRNWLIVGGMVLFLILTSPFAFAAPNEHLDWGAQLHSGASSCPSGTLVINAVQKVVNDIDSGTAGNYWAFDEYVRHIQVVDTGAGFCATVSYQGSFTSIAGDSPGAGYTYATIGDGVVGTFQGGYVATFTGTLKSNPSKRSKGSIGTYDYECNASTGDCPERVFWATLYFDSADDFADFAQIWWGWVYHAGNNGSWTNAITGNSGDITGN